MEQYAGAPAIKKQTDLSAAIIDAIGSAIVAIDRDCYVIRWNSSAAVLTGISADEIRGLSFEDTVLHAEDRDRWKREFDRISAGEAPAVFECRWKTHNSSFVPLTCSLSLIRDSAQEVECVLCTATRSLSGDFMTDRAAELSDISHFLHDTVSQDLVAIAFHLNQLENTARGRPWESDVDSAVRLIDRCCRDFRIVSYMLAPPLLLESTLETSIEMLAAFAREEVGFGIALDLDPVPNTVSSEAQLLLFAAAQAWFGRAMRARTKPALSIRLRNSPSETVLELEMVPPGRETSRTGWAVISERARALGGRFTIGGDSTRTTARLSLPGRADAR